MDRLLLDVASRQHSLILRRQVGAAGVSRWQWQRRVARGDWVEMDSGVFRHRLAVDTWQLRARAGLLKLGKDAALFGHTAAAWWGLDVPPPPLVEFVVARVRRNPCADLVVHTTGVWSSGDVLYHDGARVSSVTRAIVEMAGSGCSAHVVENAIDSGIRLRRTSHPTLVDAVAAVGGPGRDGTSLLKVLLLDSGGESKLERRFLRLVRRAHLPRPTCQVVYRADGSGRVLRVDFQFPATNVIVEVSGRLGHVTDRDRQRDARRRNELQQLGKLVLEFTTADIVADEAYVLATLRTALSARSCRP